LSISVSRVFSNATLSNTGAGYPLILLTPVIIGNILKVISGKTQAAVKPLSGVSPQLDD
jgi:hypothetical protein